MTKAATAIVMTVIGDAPSYFFAGKNKRVADAQAREPEHKQRRQPDDQIHRSLRSVCRSGPRRGACAQRHNDAGRAVATALRHARTLRVRIRTDCFWWRTANSQRRKQSIPIGTPAHKESVRTGSQAFDEAQRERQWRDVSVCDASDAARAASPCPPDAEDRKLSDKIDGK